MSVADIALISQIAPGPAPVTALRNGKPEVILFRSHLVDFDDEDLFFAMENAQ